MEFCELTVVCFLLWIVQLCQGAGADVTLRSNPEFGGLICPTTVVEFTCTAVDVSFLEWRRNGVEIATLLPTSSVGNISDPRIPAGFMIELTSVNREGGSIIANFTTILTANLSSLMNGGDRISCVSLDIIEEIEVIYTGERTAPAVPDFSHSITPGAREGLVDVTLSLEDSFISTHAVERYCVRSSEPRCPQQCVESGTPFSCPGLIAGGGYRFWVTAFNCGDQEGEESQPLVVQPRVPSTPVVSSVSATYQTSAADSALLELAVMWNPVPEIQLTDQVLALNEYRVTVEGSTGDVMVQNVTCAQSEVTCSAVFPRLEAADYRVSISVRNVVGESNTTSYPNVIFATSTSYYDPDFSFVNCITSVECSSGSLDSTRCVVRYGTDPSYTLLSDPVDGPLNSMFRLPLFDPNTMYYFVTSVSVNSSLTVEVQETFSTGEFDPRLLGYHRGLIIAGALLWTAGLLILIAISITLKIKGQPLSCLSERLAKVSLVVLIVVIATFLFVAMILWIAVGCYVGLQENTCDLDWQRDRNGLIVSAHVFSDLAFLTSLVVGFMWMCAAKFYQRGLQHGRQEAVSHTTPKQQVTMEHTSAEYEVPISHLTQTQEVEHTQADYEEVDLVDHKESQISLERNEAYGLKPVVSRRPGVGSAAQREIELHENVAYGPTGRH